MAILTCKNHPDLRWSCKDQAIFNGKYTGERNIFFGGKVANPVRWYEDHSGLDCDFAQECDCPASDLIIAPEDAELPKRKR